MSLTRRTSKHYVNNNTKSKSKSGQLHQTQPLSIKLQTQHITQTHRTKTWDTLITYLSTQAKGYHLPGYITTIMLCIYSINVTLHVRINHQFEYIYLLHLSESTNLIKPVFVTTYTVHVALDEWEMIVSLFVSTTIHILDRDYCFAVTWAVRLCSAKLLYWSIIKE